MAPTRVLSRVRAVNAKPVQMTREQVTADAALQLSRIGINFDARTLALMASAVGMGMDAAPDPLRTAVAAAGIPAQFLQSWLPGFVMTITQARKIDELIGVATVGSWEDENIIQAGMEYTGQAQPYGDLTDIPLSSWNPAYTSRTIVRFEEGLRVGRLEAARAAKANVDDAASKRAAAALALEIQRNRVGFVGYMGGENHTYGFLNDPNLPAAIALPAGAGGSSSWASKTFLEITADLRMLMARIQVQSGDTLDPTTGGFTLAIPTGSATFLSVTSEFGNSVRQWLTETWPNLRIVTAPELANAVGGENVLYLYADSVSDGYSDDGGEVFMQMVPSRVTPLGVENGAKHYTEDYTNATAGALLKRPYAVVRATGL